MHAESKKCDDLELKLSNLPKRPGVYLFKNKTGSIIYVGKAKILRNRVRSYFGKRAQIESLKVQQMVNKIHDIETIVTDSEVEALILEANLVKEYRPKYNINLRDDKSFPYIRVTNESFPRIFPTRKLLQDGSRYFGPYTDVNSLRDLLKTIKRIFPIRSCNYTLTEETVANKKYKICLDYHIKRCLGPCEGLISEDEYGKIIEYVVSFIDGHNSALEKDLEDHMAKLATQLRFEEAARLRDMLASIQDFQDKQKMVSQDASDRDFVATEMEDDDSCGVIFKVREGKIIGRQHFYLSGSSDETIEKVTSSFLKQYYLKSNYIPPEIFLSSNLEDINQIRQWLADKKGEEVVLLHPEEGEEGKLINMCKRNARLLLDELKLQKLAADQYYPKVVQKLQEDLNLKNPPRRIEAFDISNIAGREPVASMVYFLNGKALKAEYRRFKIRSEERPNDYAMMQEAMERRYSRVIKENIQLPDLVLVDGGKGQLNVALKVFNKLNITIPVVALAKRLDEVFLPGISEAQNITRSSPGLRLLQQIRDESHRFAVQYHRTLRKKRTLKSVLETIPGVGSERRKRLLQAFGSLDVIKDASVDELAGVEGISQKVAQEIWKFFHLGRSGEHLEKKDESITLS